MSSNTLEKVSPGQNTDNGVVYSRTLNGHRKSYTELFEQLFGLVTISGPPRFEQFNRIVMADRVLLAALDETPAFSCVCILARAFLRRPTVAIVMRPQVCFDHAKWHHPVKRLMLSVFKKVSKLTTITITPFSIEPRYQRVAHFGLYDPQYWDMHDGSKVREPQRSALADDVKLKAGSRAILVAVGSLSEAKGLAFLAETLSSFPELHKMLYVVCAGKASSEAIAKKLGIAGARIEDRFLSDAEVESLYGVGDLVWSVYAPAYDQASGVFGRAIQFGVTPIVRSGALIERVAQTEKLVHCSIEYGSFEGAKQELLACAQAIAKQANETCEETRQSLIGYWRDCFVEVVASALVGNRAIKRKAVLDLGGDNGQP